MPFVLIATAAALLAATSAAATPDPQWIVDQGLSALHYARFCDVAYNHSLLRYTPKMGSVLHASFPGIAPEPVKYRLHSVHAHGNTEFVTLWNDETKHLIFAFRGTDGVADALDDMKLAPMPWPFADNAATHFAGVQVHDGFITQYTAARNDLHTTLNEHVGVKSITTTGHSLGGALASVAAADLATVSKAEVSSVTFGSPRAGSEKFVEVYNTRVKHTLRVANRCMSCSASPLGVGQKRLCQDKVSLVPPPGPEYAHVVEPPTIAQLESGFNIHIGPAFELRLHSLSSYEEALSQNGME